MSGLPTRRYYKLKTEAEVENISIPSRLNCDIHDSIDEIPLEPTRVITSIPTPEQPQTGDNSFESVNRHSSVEPVQTPAPLPDADTGSNDQYQDVFYRMNSSYSGSWFTASSLMSESLTNSLDYVPESDRTPILTAAQISTDTTVTHSISSNNNCSILRSNLDPNSSGLQYHRSLSQTQPDKQDGINNNTSLEEKEFRHSDPTTLRPRRRRSQQSMTYSIDTSPNTSTSVRLVPMVSGSKSSSQISPTKLLRLRWKRLFSSRRGELSDQFDAFPETSTEFATDLPLEILETPSQDRDIPSGELIPSVSTESSSPTRKCGGTDISMKTETLEATHQDTAHNSHSIVDREPSDTHTHDVLLRFPRTSVVKPPSRQPSVPANLLYHGSSGEQISRPTRKSLPSRHSLGVMHFESDVSERKEDTSRKRLLLKRGYSEATDHSSIYEFAEALDQPDSLPIFNLPDEYRTSFEREDETDDTMIQREAHVGALALAWATGTRKSRRIPQRVESERNYNEIQRTPSSIVAVTPDSPIVKNEADKISAFSGTISSHILGNVSLRKNKDRKSDRSSARSLHVKSGLLRSLMGPSNRNSDTQSKSLESSNLCESDVAGQSTTEDEEPSGGRLRIAVQSGIGRIHSKFFPDRNTPTTENYPHPEVQEEDDQQPVRKLNDDDVSEEHSGKSSSEHHGFDEDGKKSLFRRSMLRRGARDHGAGYVAGGPLTSSGKSLIPKSMVHNIGWRLSQRKILNERRRHIADYCFVLAVTGIFFMVLELEFLMSRLYSRSSIYSMLMKSLISASTFLLVTLIIFYHALDIKLFCVNNCIEDWRIATNYRRLGAVALEVFLCLIHPPPIISNFDWSTGSFSNGGGVGNAGSSSLPSLSRLTNNSPNWTSIPPSSNLSHLLSSVNIPTTLMEPNATLNPQYQDAPSSMSTSNEDAVKYPHRNDASYARTLMMVNDTGSGNPAIKPRVEFVSIELTLSIPMFLRLYLIFRVLLLHSTFFTDAGSRSIGALNRVKINVRFVMKTIATAQPGRMLLIFILFMWVITSWMMRVCERQQNAEYEKMFNTMWLIAVTFLSIGYGDMVPNTHCGRSISVIAGVMGSACTALVVAVVARKLELSRAEKHVHIFMQDNKTYKMLRNSAADVLRETWLFYKQTRLVKRVVSSRVRHHQRKFLAAIGRLRSAKDKQRKLKEDANSMVDIAKLQTGIQEVVTHIRNDQAIFVQRLIAVEKAMSQLQVQLNQLPEQLTEIICSPLKKSSMDMMPEVVESEGNTNLVRNSETQLT